MKNNFEAQTLDDLLHPVYSELLKVRELVQATRGNTREIIAARLVLQNPRARISRSEQRGRLYSAIGEFLWYMAASNRLDFITYYLPHYQSESDDQTTIAGAYGPRLFHQNGEGPLQVVIRRLLKPDRNTSRQAVVQLFFNEDLKNEITSVPCTCTLQFLLRKGRLDLLVNMRANDAYWGLSHDIFSFTMIQELVAMRIGAELGVYYHTVGSLHLYEDHIPFAEAYLSEGWQSASPMPRMPSGDPTPDIEKVCAFEADTRRGHPPSINTDTLPEYWQEICKLLTIFAYRKARQLEKAKELARTIKCDIFRDVVESGLDGIS